jgi:hypothetical protein
MPIVIDHSDATLPAIAALNAGFSSHMAAQIDRETVNRQRQSMYRDELASRTDEDIRRAKAMQLLQQELQRTEQERQDQVLRERINQLPEHLRNDPALQIGIATRGMGVSPGAYSGSARDWSATERGKGDNLTPAERTAANKAQVQADNVDSQVDRRNAQTENDARKTGAAIETGKAKLANDTARTGGYLENVQSLLTRREDQTANDSQRTFLAQNKAASDASAQKNGVKNRAPTENMISGETLARTAPASKIDQIITEALKPRAPDATIGRYANVLKGLKDFAADPDVPAEAVRARIQELEAQMRSSNHSAQAGAIIDDMRATLHRREQAELAQMPAHDRLAISTIKIAKVHDAIQGRLLDARTKMKVTDPAQFAAEAQRITRQALAEQGISIPEYKQFLMRMNEPVGPPAELGAQP